MSSSNQPTSDLLASAVDLSQLTRPQAPAPAQAQPRRPGEVPNEFRIALVGDADGNPKVMLSFGHMQWMFTPDLAEDLGQVLIEAATQARPVPAQATPDTASTPEAPGLETP